MQVHSLQNESIDALCFRVYGHTEGAVEAVLRANPHLTSYGIFLPLGVLVDVPYLTPPPPRPTLKLWD